MFGSSDDSEKLCSSRPKVEASRSLTDIPEDSNKEELNNDDYRPPSTSLRRYNSGSACDSRPRLRSRRCAVSASDELSEEETNKTNAMPIKRNSFRITARFIGSMQMKHNISKSKAERIAAAAAMATYMTDESRYYDVIKAAS